MEVILSSKVKLLPIPSSKISWMKTLPPSQQQSTVDNPPNNVVSKTLILTSGNELRYFELRLQKKQQKLELKKGNEWTHSFDNQDSLEILHVDSESPEFLNSELLLITKESSGLGFYTKANSTGSTLIKKGTDIRFSNTFGDTPRNFKDHFAMGKIWCGINFDNDIENLDDHEIVNNCEDGNPRLGAILHRPNPQSKGNSSISFYFLHKYTILGAPPAKKGKDSLFPLEKIHVQLPAEVEENVEKVWIIPMPSTSANSKKKSVNDVIIFQKGGQLFLFQLNESSHLIKFGDLKLPVGLPGMENENEMTVSSLNFFFSSSLLNLAVTFKSTTVIFSLDEKTRQFHRSSFFYFDKGQTPLFFEDQEELRKTPRNEKQPQLFVLLDGPKAFPFSSNSGDFRPISLENPKMNPLHFKVIATTTLTLSKLRQNEAIPNPILFYEDQNTMFAASLTLVKNRGEIWANDKGTRRTGWKMEEEMERLDDYDCFNEECLFDSLSFNSSRLLTAGSASDSGSAPENTLPVQKLEKYKRKNLWDKSILDMIPVKQIAESAALPTGQIQFNLPLIPLVGFSVSYASNSDSDSSGSATFPVLGHEDWKISSHPFVVRVRKSVFEKLDKFYLILESQPHPLTLQPTSSSSSSSEIREFTSSTASQYTKILYYSSASESSNSVGKSYWEFESAGATAFFGQKPDAPVPTDNALRFQYEARMRNWAGSSTLKFPVEWHLIRFVNHAIGQSFDYNYRPFNQTSDPNSNFKWNQIEPQALLISNVTSIPYKNGTSDSINLELQFNYGEVKTGDRSKILLNGYNMTTESYRQIVKFQYDNPNSNGKLSRIRQEFCGLSREMLKFSYSNHSEAESDSFRPFDTAIDLSIPSSKNTTLLSKVEFPTLKTSVQFTFSQPGGFQLPRRPEAVIIGNDRNKYTGTAAGTPGFSFSAVTLDNFLHFYKHSDGSVQTVKFAEASEIASIENVKVVIDSSCAFLHFRIKSQVKVQAYRHSINPTPTQAGIGGEPNWHRVAEKLLPSSSRIILSHDGTIFQAIGQRLDIHEWTEMEETNSGPSRNRNGPPSYGWQSSSFTTNRPPKALQLQGNFLSWMEVWTGGSGTQLKYLPYREREQLGGAGGWNSANLKSHTIPDGREDCFSFFSRKLTPSQKKLDNLWDFFHQGRPPIETNLVAFPSCRIKSDDRTVVTVLDFLVLDKDEAVQSHHTYTVDQENIQNSAKWDWSNFSVGVAPQSTILIGGKNKIFWDVKSSRWSLVKESLQNSDTVDLKLNEDGLKLQKSGRQDTLKIKKGAQNQVVKDLGIKATGQLVNFFPDYMLTLAGLNNSRRFHLLEFPSTDKSVVKEMRIEGESILPGLTTPQILGTLIQSSSVNSSTQIRLRTMAYRPQAILTQVKVEGGKFLQRKTGYDYSDARILANGRLIFGTRKVIPGARPHVNGWMEYTDSFQGNPKIFDNRGNFLGRMQQRDILENEEIPSELASYCIRDKTGSQQILDTRPYLLSECKVGYYGFQEYEKKRAGEDCSDWEFPEENVISNDFALTGTKFLRLGGAAQTLSTSFLLDSESGEDYTVSAWVRSPLIKLEHSISPILKAKVQGMEKLTWLSKILLEEDGWHLLQINILAHELDAYTKALYSDTNNNNNNNSTSTSRPLSTIGQGLNVTITISGQQATKGKPNFVDVDHVLYAPSGWNSEISVFDPSTLRVTDRILGRSGLVSHNKFDSFGNPLAQINSEGGVMHYEIRAPSPQGTNTANSDVLLATAKFEVTGAAGWYESCDPSLQQSLSLQNHNRWQLSPGFANHIGNSTEKSESSLFFKIRDQKSVLFRFTYDISVPSFSNLNGSGVFLQYKNLNILSIGKSSQNNMVKLTFGTSLFSGISNLNPAALEIPPTSSISFAVLEKERVFVWIEDELKLDAKFTPATTQSIIETGWKNFIAIKVPPRASISVGDILILPNPKVKMSYSNIFGEKIQEIEVVSKGQVRVGQILYDDLGRSVAVTKPTVVDVSSSDPLLSFRSSFVTRFVQRNQRMRMDGEVSRLNPEDGGFPISMVKYEPSSFFETVSVEGRPGVDFSIGGRFQKVYQSKNSHEFVRILFPENEGFQYRVSKTMNAQSFYEEVLVYKKGLDGSEQTHASVVISQTGKNLLATYDYDKRGNLIAAHSPEFHKQFQTVLKRETWENLRKTINSRQNELATFYKYDDWNRLVQKSSPDMGIVSIIYEPTSDKVKYAAHRTRENPGEIKSIMYYEYENEGGSLSEVGILKGFNPSTEQSADQSLAFLSSLVKIPKRVVRAQENSELASMIFKTDLVVSSFEVNEGNSTARFQLFENYVEMVDTKISTMKIVTRTAVFPTKRGIPALLVPTSFQYNAQADKSVRINLPFQDYGILYRYDTLGQLSSISLSVPNSLAVSGSVRSLIPGIVEIANFEYDGSGGVIRERLHGFNKKNSLNTTISYNSPGFLTDRINQFIKESLSYEDDGYGDHSAGAPSSVMTSTTTRLWENPEAQFYKDASDFVQSGVSPKTASTCYSKLEEFGYIQNETVVKMFHPKMDHRLPVVCTSGSPGQQIQQVFTEKVLKTRPLPVSFKYQYGPHQDLVKVKFVVEQDEQDRTGNKNGNDPFCSKPLTNQNFLEQLKRELKKSQIERDAASLKPIWDRLVKSGFLWTASETASGPFSQIHWKPGQSLFNPALLNTILKDNVLDFKVVTLMMQHLASVVGVQIGEDSDKNLKQVWKLWQPEDQQIEQKAKTLVKNLIDDGFLASSNSTSNSQDQVLQVNSNVFDPEFLAAFDPDPNSNLTLKGLVYKTLLSFFDCAVGSSPLDKEVWETDLNGNFKLFYNGQEKIELEYSEGTNRIKSINLTSNELPQKVHNITHDHFGNLNSAPHHKIDSISYDEITAKPILMRLANGSFLKFRYDLRGERVTKEVFGPSGALVKKIKYLSRDEHGRSLLEEETIFVSPDLPPKTRTTLYIYNPDRKKGLVGFIRGGKLYNVFTDNINSVRLVILDGHVVGAWDYFPYGNTINEYVQHEDASIPYRFSGQELDQEAGLYNFHARIYDPFLGRFYQIDPEEQFFSPYKYAGNSPLNSVDPDGREIFTRVLEASAGTYMGGSSANNNWDPAKWKWGGLGTFPGIPRQGASASQLTPFLDTAGTAFGYGSFGAGSAYLVAASANQEGNSRKSPETFNVLYPGIAMGVALPSGVSSYGALLSTFTKSSQVLVNGATLTSGVGFSYFSASSTNQNNGFWDYDFSNPAEAVNFGASEVSTSPRSAAIYSNGRYSSKQQKLAFPGFQNVAKEITEFLKQKKLSGVSPVFSPEGASAAGKILGAFTAVGMGGFVIVSAANDGWILADWTNAGNYAAIVNGMWGGWSGASGSLIATGEGSQYLRKQITTPQDHERSWFGAATSPLKIKFDLLSARVSKIKNVSQVSGSNLTAASKANSKDVLTPTLKLTNLGNSKWKILGFSGQGKGGIVHLNLKPAPCLNSPSSKSTSTSTSDSISYMINLDTNVQKRIQTELEKSQKVLSYFSKKNADGKVEFLAELHSTLCDSSPPSTGTGTECEEKSKLIATALEELVKAKLRDGTFLKVSDFELTVLSIIEWAEKKVMIKSLLQELATDHKIPSLGDDLLSAQFNLNQLKLKNPGDEKIQSKYAVISNNIKTFILKAVQKSMVKNQGVFKGQARILSTFARNPITDTSYKVTLGDWAASNCGKAVVQSAMIKARKILRLDNDNPNEMRVRGVDCYAIYNPRMMKKTSLSRCSQCLDRSSRENFDVGVEQLRFIVTKQSWRTKINQVDPAFFFENGAQNKASSKLSVIEDEDDEGFRPEDKPRISRSIQNPLHVETGNFTSPKIQRLQRDASSGSAHSAASSHGGIIQSLHKTIKNILNKPFEMHHDFGFRFWTTGEELKSPAVHEEYVFEKSGFHPQISKEEKAEENGGDRAFSTRCLPFYTKGGDEFADAIDILGLSCSSALGRMIVFYPDPREQMLSPLISGQSSSSSSSSSWNMKNQLHSFDKNSCQFLSSFNGQTAAFCQGSKSNILYMPNPPVQKPLDSLNDQLLLLLLAQHFLQNSGWFGFKTPETESTETGKSETEEEEEVLSPDELNSFDSTFKAELQGVKRKRDQLILQLKTQQQKEGEFKKNESFLHFCHFYIQDLEEEFFLDIEKSKLSGFSSQQKTEYLDRLAEIEVEMHEDFQALSEFRWKSNEDFSSQKKTGDGNSVWSFVEGLFYTFHHKSQ